MKWTAGGFIRISLIFRALSFCYWLIVGYFTRNVLSVKHEQVLKFVPFTGFFSSRADKLINLFENSCQAVRNRQKPLHRWIRNVCFIWSPDLLVISPHQTSIKNRNNLTWIILLAAILNLSRSVCLCAKSLRCGFSALFSFLFVSLKRNIMRWYAQK